MNKEILYLSPTYGGKVHDKKICDQEKLLFFKDVQVITDLGFLGFGSETAHIMMPFKEKKSCKLNPGQEQFNSWLSKIRVRIEHTIASVKIFRKAKETFRGRLFKREDTVMLIACALHNLKLKHKFA